MMLMLEDNAERIARFQAVLVEIAPSLPVQIWRDAWTMLREMEAFLPVARLISLDHDLEPEHASAPDPGTGWDVTKVLAALPPVCPVVIHTSNADRSSWMCGEFELGGWEYYRVPPLGDDWIEVDWRRIVRKVLRRAARP